MNKGNMYKKGDFIWFPLYTNENMHCKAVKAEVIDVKKCDGRVQLVDSRDGNGELCRNYIIDELSSKSEPSYDGEGTYTIHGKTSDVFSSREKCIAHINKEYDKGSIRYMKIKLAAEARLREYEERKRWCEENSDI